MDMTLTDMERDEVNVGVRMDRDVKALLENLARRRTTSVSATVRMLVLEEANRLGLSPVQSHPS